MERTVFRATLAATPWSEQGIDEARFLVSPNIGEEPRPLDKVASGGEISRIALALKTCAAAPKPRAWEEAPRTLVFDEVDAGIGGRAPRLWDASENCLRRPGSVCTCRRSQASNQYVSRRRDRRPDFRRRQELGEARAEVGACSSGKKVTAEALKHAEKLIRTSSG
jgi:DNA repair protein RecN (Recombination protein N)